jgi:WD40 repeat protein
MAQVFISYSRMDRDFVRQLHEALEKTGRDAWVDWEDIPFTAEWRKEIYAGIEAADNFIFVISPDSVASIACREEAAYASGNNKRLIPILRRPVAPSEVPESLASINFIHFQKEDDFGSTFKSLIDTLDTDLAWKRIHTRLLLRAREWEQGARDNSLLLRGNDLRDTEHWLAQVANKEPRFTYLQRAFVQASRAALEEQAHKELQRQHELRTEAEARADVEKDLRLQAQRATRLEKFAAAQARRFGIRSRWLSFALLSLLLIALGITWFARQERVIAESRALLITLRGHTGTIRSAIYSPDGQRILTASNDNTARIWSAATGQMLATLKGHTDIVTSALYAPNARLIVTGSGDNTAKIWDAANGQLLLTLNGHTNAIWSAQFSPDSQRIVTASSDNTARIWDATTGQSLITLQGHTNSVESADYSPDGQRILTCSNDGTARLWDAASGRLLITLGSSIGDVTNAVFAPDGQRILTTGYHNPPQVWDDTFTHLLLNLQGDANYSKAIFSPNGKRILLYGGDTAGIWDAASGRLLTTVKSSADRIYSAVFSPDSLFIVTASGHDFSNSGYDAAQIWNATTGQLRATMRGHTGQVWSAVFSPDGQRVLTGSADNTARVSNPAINSPN